MIVSESMAREKWCPFARVFIDTIHTGYSSNRDDVSDATHTHCLGPKCMAWVPCEGGRGYCGLVYKPEKEVVRFFS